MEYIEVAVPLPVYQTYHYSIPHELSIQPIVGKRVQVPFGQQQVSGYVLGSAQAKDPSAIKQILDVLDDIPLFPESMIPFFRWISDYYMHPLGEVIKEALPSGINKTDQLKVALTGEDLDKGRPQNLTPAEAKILKRLAAGPCTLKSLYRDLETGFPVSLIYSLERKGMLKLWREVKPGRTKPKMERHVSASRPFLPYAGRSTRKQEILTAVRGLGEVPVRKLQKTIPSASRHLKDLADSGYLSVFEKRVFRDPFGEPIPVETGPTLTDEQRQAFGHVEASIGAGFSTYLLAGVTGSGKTEIYIRLAEKAITKGYSVLVLVPEIALISQMEKRFRARFGSRIALLHSALSAGERYDQWVRILNRSADIAIGARSAIFAPFRNIGLVIVDEEHDTSYKQEGRLRYNARDLAVVRAKQHKCVSLLGSATPSLESYHNVLTGKYHSIRLTRRVENRSLPEIQTVDLRKIRDYRGTGRFISSDLHSAMQKALARGEQVLLFLNRRGFASYPVCTACGNPIKCRNCEISLTLHQRMNAYKCHYCGYTRPSDTRCPDCGSSAISRLGIGTEKVEEAVKGLFPDARVMRMDRDTTVRKGSILKMLKALKSGAIDVLVGTQMVAKGHDFPNITLVGIICADLTLNFPDFRASERTFQLLAQVAGRAGRGAAPGQVILQTYAPDHFSIQAARKQDFEMFYREDAGFRESLGYPPFSRMILLRFSGRDKTHTAEVARLAGEICRDLAAQGRPPDHEIRIMGPLEAPIPKMAGQYRWQILLKGNGYRPLRRLVWRFLSENPALHSQRKARVAVDVDPFLMM